MQVRVHVMLMCTERVSTPNNAKCIHAAADIPLQNNGVQTECEDRGEDVFITEQD